MNRHNDTSPKVGSYTSSDHSPSILADGSGDSSTASQPNPSGVLLDQHDVTSLNRLFDALSHPARRLVLRRLDEHDASDEAAVPLYDLVPDYGRHETELYHVHLPRLVDYDYIEWDASAETVAPGANFDETVPFLTLAYETQA